MKVSVVKKDQTCCVCEKDIPAGEKVLCVWKDGDLMIRRFYCKEDGLEALADLTRELQKGTHD